MEGTQCEEGDTPDSAQAPGVATGTTPPAEPADVAASSTGTWATAAGTSSTDPEGRGASDAVLRGSKQTSLSHWLL